MKKPKEWLILNAVKTWLYHYKDQEEAEVLRPQYEDLNKELHRAYIEQTEVPKRGRPAKRARTKKTASNQASKEASQTT
jgi:hypothetical protein